MPVRLSKLGIEEKIIVEWKVSQANAYGAKDKWHATINCIFDSNKTAKPDALNRNYDLVIQSDSHNTEEGFYDDDNTGENGETRAHYYATNKDGDILPFTINIDGKDYSYAVRYKIFHGGDKKEKIHVKYTPLDKANTPRKFKYDIQKFIENSKDFIRHTALKNQGIEDYKGYKSTLAKGSLYLKSISAGYEVYEGNSVLKNDLFKVTLVPVVVE
jgi:hypothetical protein